MKKVTLLSGSKIRMNEFFSSPITVEHITEHLAFLKAAYPNTFTIRNVVTRYRNVARMSLNPIDLKLFLNTFKTPEESIEVNENYKQSVILSNENLDNVQKVSIAEYENYIAIAVKHLKSFNKNDLVWALCLLSGRRPVEIGVTGTFTFFDNHNVLFYGQAKKRDFLVECYVIPVLCDSKLFIEAVKRLREIVKFDSNESFANHTQTPVQKRINRVLSPKFTCKVFRAMYALYLLNDLRNNNENNFKYYSVNGDKIQSYSQNAMIARLLGHSDLNTANSYFRLINLTSN